MTLHLLLSLSDMFTILLTLLTTVSSATLFSLGALKNKSSSTCANVRE